MGSDLSWMARKGWGWKPGVLVGADLCLEFRDVHVKKGFC